jgi:plasmid stabilization system protein ParE
MNARISARAQGDLEGIFAHIASRRGLKAAADFLDGTKAAIELLLRNPEAGPRPGWATRHKALRFWVISRTNYLIYYFPEPAGISIERVLDGRRDATRILDLGMENPSE